MTLDEKFRALVAEIVREEVAKAIAAVQRPEEYLTTRAAGDLAAVAEGTIRRWIREGRIVGHRAGRVLRVKRSELERLLTRAPKPSNDERLTPRQLAERDFG